MQFKFLNDGRARAHTQMIIIKISQSDAVNIRIHNTQALIQRAWQQQCKMPVLRVA